VVGAVHFTSVNAPFGPLELINPASHDRGTEPAGPRSESKNEFKFQLTEEEERELEDLLDN
jgi:hypothetical protein